ncbi:hypothetical protein [Roseiterribacter gracilis]|uniref:DUF2927 domain-containing protein n=1 Tax=Roseiterribacter gracilis TaxID=2812848 RepID=A0A8S8X953_9PROT|nr:hypothetical protein TMPK1_06680 [Rhodospirillales bacterium TMPK1]
MQKLLRGMRRFTTGLTVAGLTFLVMQPVQAQGVDLPAYARSAMEVCEPTDFLCRHLRYAFSPTLRNGRRSGPLHLWHGTMRVATSGLSDDGRAQFVDILRGLAMRAHIEVIEVPSDDAAGGRSDANVLFLAGDDIEALAKAPRVASLNRPNTDGVDRTLLLRETPYAFLLTRPSDDITKPRMEHCVMAATKQRLTEQAALTFARLSFRCLTGARTSDVIQPSLLNTVTAASPLASADGARMSALDSELLKAMYDPTLNQERFPASETTDKIVARLHAMGFGSDGKQR